MLAEPALIRSVTDKAAYSLFNKRFVFLLLFLVIKPNPVAGNASFVVLHINLEILANALGEFSFQSYVRKTVFVLGFPSLKFVARASDRNPDGIDIPVMATNTRIACIIRKRSRAFGCILRFVWIRLPLG